MQHRRPTSALAGPRKLSKFDHADTRRQVELERKAAEVARMMEGEKPRKGRKPAA